MSSQGALGNVGEPRRSFVSGFGDSVDHGLLQDGIGNRVNDGGIVRLSGTWLHAGVLDGEQLTDPEQGTPQGGVRA
jgi:RNA-directed DNA polymerase